MQHHASQDPNISFSEDWSVKKALCSVDPRRGAQTCLLPRAHDDLTELDSGCLNASKLMLADVPVTSQEFQDRFYHRGLIWSDYHWLILTEQHRSRQLAVPVCDFFRGLMEKYGESMDYFPEAPPRTSLIQATEGFVTVCGHRWLLHDGFCMILWHLAQKVLHWVC